MRAGWRLVLAMLLASGGAGACGSDAGSTGGDSGTVDSATDDSALLDGGSTQDVVARESGASDSGTTSIPLPTTYAPPAFFPNWTDRRPIGELVLAPVDGKGAAADGYGPGNPRGWFASHTVDITTAPGVAAFQKQLLSYAAGSVTVLQSIHAQGAITWDVEGEEYPQATTYIGDPTLEPQMAPELESTVVDTSSPYQGMKLVDAYFKTFTDAGLRVGVTLRPQQMEFNNPADCHLPGDLRNTCQPFLTDSALMTKLLSERIAYAKQRWGMSIFYVDSNVVADQYWKCAPSDPNQDPSTCPDPQLLSGARSRLGGLPIEAAVFHAVASAAPDVLITPEHHADAYFADVAPLWQLFQDFGTTGNNYQPAHTPDALRASYPGAFSTIIINNAGLAPGDQRYGELVTGVNEGDILIARAWFDDQPDLGTLAQIYSAAGAMPAVPRVIPAPAVAVSRTGPGSVTIAWTTASPASTRVVYGPDASYGSQVSDAALAANHAAALTGLLPAAVVHFSARSTYPDGTVAASDDISFTFGP